MTSVGVLYAGLIAIAATCLLTGCPSTGGGGGIDDSGPIPDSMQGTYSVTKTLPDGEALGLMFKTCENEGKIDPRVKKDMAASFAVQVASPEGQVATANYSVEILEILGTDSLRRRFTVFNTSGMLAALAGSEEQTCKFDGRKLKCDGKLANSKFEPSGDEDKCSLEGNPNDFKGDIGQFTFANSKKTVAAKRITVNSRGKYTCDGKDQGQGLSKGTIIISDETPALSSGTGCTDMLYVFGLRKANGQVKGNTKMEQLEQKGTN